MSQLYNNKNDRHKINVIFRRRFINELRIKFEGQPLQLNFLRKVSQWLNCTLLNIVQDNLIIFCDSEIFPL